MSVTELPCARIGGLPWGISEWGLIKGHFAIAHGNQPLHFAKHAEVHDALRYVAKQTQWPKPQMIVVHDAPGELAALRAAFEGMTPAPVDSRPTIRFDKGE